MDCRLKGRKSHFVFFFFSWLKGKHTFFFFFFLDPFSLSSGNLSGIMLGEGHAHVRVFSLVQLGRTT